MPTMADFYAAEAAGGQGKLVHAVARFDVRNAPWRFDAPPAAFYSVCGRWVRLVEPYLDFADAGPTCLRCSQELPELPPDPFQEVIDLGF